MTKLLEKLEQIDRRWLYLVMLAAVVLPFLLHLELPVGKPSPSTTSVYDYIDELPAGSVIQIAFDYAPASMPELEPMAKAIVRHAFRKNHRILAMTLHPQGALMIKRVIDAIGAEMDKEYGVDWVNAGYKPGGVAVILGMARDIPEVYANTDALGNRLSTLPMMKGIVTYDDIALMVDIASNSLPFAWVAYAHEQYNLSVAAGVTAVMATDLYPYWTSGQLVGVINGLKGAAEYEQLVGAPGLGLLGMSSQSICHVLIILFIVLGNVGYFLKRRKR